MSTYRYEYKNSKKEWYVEGVQYYPNITQLKKETTKVLIKDKEGTIHTVHGVHIEHYTITKILCSVSWYTVAIAANKFDVEEIREHIHFPKITSANMYYIFS